ncbi:hypothetical protein [Chryseobacterium sp. R2A-55]|uniref:hypothetical protein n=1 Tax=Chryseobacterium sp. R2A-55 TaxID=2744445 RepID=UPI001F2C9AA8|nr:hypothetical protein [Chryseobacterium sp. R2A-55]
MKTLLIIFTILSITRCDNPSRKVESIKSGFITESGTYYWGRNQNIIMKNIGDDEKIFAITTENGKILYQQPINITFSDYHKWTLYVDEKQNAYFYNGDYQETKALIWNKTENKFNEINFCQKSISLPADFKKKLLDPNLNFTSCKSLE